MGYNVKPLDRLIEQFERLPGIGKKSAQRLAFYVLNMPEENAKQFARDIVDAKTNIRRCSVCCNLTDGETCSVCSDPSRDHSTICVVESPKDVFALERTREINAVYHVLHGVISPMDGITPDDLTIKQLLARIGTGEVKELIMATNPDAEGEVTSMYISKLTKPLGIKVTRLAYGIPVGGDLEFADEVTLMRAIDGRSEI
ncbi:MAG: recombination protein RecR [Clostridia bacterium]|nr:recombination protein RecR [Clostridia bacterium]